MQDAAYYELEAELPTTENGSLFLAFLTYSEVIVENNMFTEFAIEHFRSKVKQAVYLKRGLKRLEVVLGTYEDGSGRTQLSGYVLNARDLQFEFFRYLNISNCYDVDYIRRLRMSYKHALPFDIWTFFTFTRSRRKAQFWDFITRWNV